ncbi:MAG TPA: hypothetical protein VFG23_04855, partial [Polyangia bacterium]|nr:hypothetical protein [Polyangia bacterium]
MLVAMLLFEGDCIDRSLDEDDASVGGAVAAVLEYGRVAQELARSAEAPFVVGGAIDAETFEPTKRLTLRFEGLKVAASCSMKNVVPVAEGIAVDDWLARLVVAVEAGGHAIDAFVEAAPVAPDHEVDDGAVLGRF